MRTYTAEIEIASLSAAKTVLLLELPADMCVIITSAHILNADTDTNEQLNAGLFRVSTKGTPAGTSVTPEKKSVGDVASGLTVLGNLTTEPTTYASKGLDRQGSSNLAGYRYDPLPEERDEISPSALVGLRLLDAPSAGFKATCQIVFMEVGG